MEARWWSSGVSGLRGTDGRSSCFHAPRTGSTPLQHYCNTTTTTNDRCSFPKPSFIVQLNSPKPVSRPTFNPIIYHRINPRVPHLRNFNYQLPRSREQHESDWSIPESIPTLFDKRSNSTHSSIFSLARHPKVDYVKVVQGHLDDVGTLISCTACVLAASSRLATEDTSHRDWWEHLHMSWRRE
jgi:hypothetical protein